MVRARRVAAELSYQARITSTIYGYSTSLNNPVSRTCARCGLCSKRRSRVFHLHTKHHFVHAIPVAHARDVVLSRSVTTELPAGTPSANCYILKPTAFHLSEQPKPVVQTRDLILARRVTAAVTGELSALYTEHQFTC